MIDSNIIGLVSVLIALVSYFSYFRGIFLRKIKPHAFSWLVWAITPGIVFIIQMQNDGGPGAWVTGFTSLSCVLIFVLGLRYGTKRIHPSDFFSLLAAIVAILIWYFTDHPLYSIILGICIDSLGAFPTFRKSYYNPHEEGVLLFFLSGLKFVIALFALESFSLLTTLYPAALIILNWLLVAFLVIRKKQLRRLIDANNQDIQSD